MSSLSVDDSSEHKLPLIQCEDDDVFLANTPILRVHPVHGQSGDERPNLQRNSESRLFSSNSDLSLEEKTQQHFNTLQQLLTHVPNLLIKLTQMHYTNKLPITLSSSHAVFMFIDVSGFTALCEKYCSDISAGKRGIDALTSILNRYLGKLVQHIIESNGDVLKFAGDAILAMWTCNVSEAYEVLMWVTKTALLLQTKYDNFQADEHSVLRVKVAISVGEYSTHIFGCNTLLQFAVCGAAVASVNRAQSAATSGSVILSPEAWEICTPKDFDFSKVEGSFYRITAIHLIFDPQWMHNYLQAKSENPPLMHNIFLSMLKNETDRKLRTQKRLKKSRHEANSCDSRRKRVKAMTAAENIKNGFRRLSTFQFRSNSFRTLKETEAEKPVSAVQESLSQRRLAYASSTDTISYDVSRLSSIAESTSRHSSGIAKHYRNRKSTLNTILQEQLSISKQLTPSMLDNIRKFLPKAVRSKIESGQSLEWLSELRTISVLFINLDVCIQKLTEEKIKLIQEALVYVQEIMNAFDGVVNKIFMFDKGCTILALFGLPHAKHEDDSTRALQASAKIFSHLSSHLKLHTSIGISTGQAFCGVVGHNLRHEYTVIGAKVNMAARLMMNFRDKITCDLTTKSRSGVTEANFTEMPAIPLKGIENPEPIYMFSIRDNSQLEHYDVHCDAHSSGDKNASRELVGREAEMEILLGMLNQITLDESPESHILIITGDTGIGKTSLLRSMKSLARSHSFRVLSCRAGLMEMSSHYHTVRVLIERLLQLETCHSLHEREQAILTQFQDACDDDIIEYLPLLNDLLMLKYTQTDRVSHLTAEQRHSHLHRLLFNIVEQETSNQSCVFVVDDAHYMDKNSWEFLQDLSNHQKVILVIAMKALTSSKYPEHLRTMVKSKNARVCHLTGLDHECILELTKRLLNVATIGDDFAKFLKERLGSHGNPMWCEEALDTMLNLGLFHIEQVSRRKCGSLDAGALHRELHSELKATSMESGAPATRGRRHSRIQFAAHVNTEAINLPLPESLNDLILARLDKLNASSQLVLKCAAIIGTTFSKSILKQITPNNIRDSTLDQAIEKLIQAGMVECAYASAFLSSTTKNLARYRQLCSCIQHLAHVGQKQSRNLHSLHLHDQTHYHIYFKCDMLKFTHNYIQEIVYELWTSSQRRQLHETGAKCLESEAHKCSNCGGGAFLNGIHQFETAIHELRQEDALNTLDEVFVGRGSITNHTHANKRKRSSSVYMRNGRYRATLTPSKNSSTHSLTQSPMSRDPDSPIDLSNCTCSEVLATVYPQLVRHWKAASNFSKMFHYLLEAALASTEVHATLEAQSLLEEAGELIQAGKVVPTLLQRSRFLLIKGQSFYNGRHYTEAQLHFLEGLSILNSPLPSSRVAFFASLLKQCLPQLRAIYTREYALRPEQLSSARELLLTNERLSFLSFLINTYYFTDQRYRMLNTTLTMLNQAQSSRSNNKALLESYRMMLKCCELFRFRRGLAHYQSQTALAITQCETRGNENITELIAYIELVSTLVNEHLYSGDLCAAKNYAKRAIRLSRSIRALDLLLDILPLWCYIQLHSLELGEVQRALEELRECAFDSDDLQQQALYFSYAFDIILETGIVEGLVDVIECESFARTCTSHDVFHFNNEERFFLLSCLALWYARKEIEMDAKIHFAITERILPRKIESFFAAKGLLRFTECALILWSRDRSRERRKTALRALSQLTKACQTYVILKPRLLLLKSYFNVIKSGSKAKCQKLMLEGKREANSLNSNLEILWIQHHMDYWNKRYGPGVVEVFSDTKLWQECRYDRMKLEIYSLQRERKRRKPSTPDLPPLPESELLDETLRNGLLTPDFPPPPSPLCTDGLLPQNQLTSQSQMDPVVPANPQKLYPQLDMSSPPLWGGGLPLSPLTPPTQGPSGLQALPQMERNPLFVPEQPPSCLLPDLMLLGAMPPGLVMNPLTQQLILAQQQALSQHLSAGIPQGPFHHQVHPNNIMPANFMTGFQNFSPHNFNNMSAPFGHFNEGQFESNETWNEDDDAEWKRDLMLKEKRILRDKYGDNHMNIFTDRQTNKPNHHFQTDPQETENMSPLVPNSPEPEKCDSSFQCESQPQECLTEDSQSERICYPSLPLNSSDEEPSNVPRPTKDNETTKILPAFLSRMKNSNVNKSHPMPPPPHDTSHATLFNNQNIPTQNSTETHETHQLTNQYNIETHETHYFNEQQTNQYNIPQNVPNQNYTETHETLSFNEQLTNHYSVPQNAPRDIPSPLPLPIYYPPTSELTWTPIKPILYPPEHIPNPAPIRPVTKHPREIKRPPLDTSRSPSPLKPCKREISYPPGLEPTTSPKKQVIYYPPSDHKRIRYPPRKDVIRQPSTSCFPNKSSSFHFNNESSFTGDKEILYPHSWTEALSPSGSPAREIHYPPRPPVPSDASFGEPNTPDTPDTPEETGGEVTPPIQDSSDNEEVSGTRSCPLESTPIKKPHNSNTEDKPDLDSDLGGFETPTEID